MCQPSATRDETSHQTSVGHKATCKAPKRRSFACYPRRLYQIQVAAAFLICSSVVVCSRNDVTNQQKAVPAPQLRLRRCISLASEMALSNGPTSRRTTVYSPAHSPLPELANRVPRSGALTQFNPQPYPQNSEIPGDPGEAHESHQQVYTRIQTQLYPHLQF